MRVVSIFEIRFLLESDNKSVEALMIENSLQSWLKTSV